jgi:hypothetical protein
MKPISTALLILLLLAGCRTPHQGGLSQGDPNTKDQPVVVFTYEDPELSAPMKFYLKGTCGIVLRHDPSAGSPSLVSYELFAQQGGRLLATQDELEFKRALRSLPASAKVDFYDTCTVSLSSKEEKEVLRYCDEVGIAGVCYVMCTDFHGIGKPRPWRWARRAEPDGARAETNPGRENRGDSP